MQNFNCRTKNTIRNMSFGLLGRVINLILPFIIRTIILQKLGVEYVGLGSLFSSILQVLSVAELGFSSAIIFSLYRPAAEENINEICEWLTLYKRIYQIVGGVILIAGLAILPFLSLLIKGEHPADINLYILYLIYLFNTVISYFAFAFKEVLLIVYQRRDILSTIEIIINITRSIVQIIVLLVSENYYLYIIWLPIFTFITNLFVEFITRQRYPELKCVKHIKKEKLAGISNQIKGVALGKLSLVARNAFDSIILSTLCGLTTVTMYSNYYYVFSSVSTILAVLIQSMSASVGNSIAIESKKKNLSDHNKIDFYYMWIAGLCCVCMTCLYQPFMLMWVGDNLMLPQHTMILFCIYFYVNQLGQIRSIYSEAAGLWWKFRYITIGEMIANLLLNFILGFWLEIDGIIIATIITAFISSFVGITLVTFKNYFQVSAIQYFINNLFYMAITFLCCLISLVICRNIKINNIVGFGLRILVCIILPNIIYFISFFMIPQYRNYMKELKNIIYRLNHH